MTVGEFHFEPSVGELFTIRNARNREIYENRMARLSNETRINMLLRKFGKSDHDLYLDYLLSLSPMNSTFEEMIEKCNRRFKCLNLAICEDEDIHNYSAGVIQMCNAFSCGLLKQHICPKNRKPKCLFCDDLHFYKDCHFYKHRCQDCNSYGHKEGFYQSS
ncbi:unnamed protein product [Hymenolepis diminuta]|uniref:DUF7083 domain-containing protein n=1 Tax=Hymenolepis diminuta TaxID=6216 RepID=A0A564YDQ1_HYMDI|nr:unnamed protein product [Hymenolepis diminuta]